MERLSKVKAKWIRSLRDKKNREEAQVFVVEGKKLVSEALQAGCDLQLAVALQESYLDGVAHEKAFLCSDAEMDSISSLDHPEGVLAVISFPSPEFFRRVARLEALPMERCFWLDGIQDPGNLGTLTRIADWFGFTTIVCGPGTADCFNAKALRASMGSIFRVRFVYVHEWIDAVQHFSDRILIADMEGIPAHEAPFSKRPYLLLGNEANGVSEAVRAVHGLERVTIPRIGSAESLNAAVSGGILAYLSACKAV